MQEKHTDLVSLFKAVVQQYPDRIALRDHQRSLSYFELYKYAGQLAHGLRNAHCSAGQRIVCVSKKDVESMICFWGILLMGGVPVMVDQEDGIPANEEKIHTVKASAIICDKSRYMQPPKEIPVFDISSLIDLLVPADSIPDPEPVELPEVCYILTTSGTTGKPKAVLISHGNVVHYTYSIYEKLGCPEKVNAVHASTFAADLGLTNTLVALVSGGMLRILNKTEATDPAIFNEIIDTNEISLLKITPSHLLSLLSNRQKPYRKPIHTVVLGGEKLSWETVKLIFAEGICTQLFNHYGPTETTIGAIAFRISPDYPGFERTGSVPLGSPLGAGACFVDDVADQVGELLIYGPGVSIGYFENETENKKKFIVKERNGLQIQCYRTGDICRKLDDGNYEFLYRTDRQVKVKGYRIELGEVEIAMAAHPAIEHVIVTLSDNQQHTSIEAYVKPMQGKELSAEILRKWMLEKLPAYKIPSAFYFYTKAPYNSNGKIDMQALKSSFKETVAVVTETSVADEHSWAALVESSWKKVLQKQQVQPSDNFFETGGDSLLAIQFIGRLQRNGFKVHITDLNSHPVFAELVALNPGSNQSIQPTSPHREDTQYLTVSQEQFLYQSTFNLDEYCQTILLETDVKIRVRELALALNCVLDGHALLSASFAAGGKPVHTKDQEESALELTTSVLLHRFPIITQIQDAAAELLRSIDINNGKLFAAHVFVDPQGKDYLFLACHHLCVDVISWHIIIDELLDYYDQILQGIHPSVTTENAVQQFYAALNRTPENTVIHPAKEELFKLPGSEKKENTPATFSMSMPPAIATRLKRTDTEDQASLFSGYLLSALTNAMFRELSLSSISIDIEFHGRPQHEKLPDLSRSVGWWAVSMPLSFHQGANSADQCAALVENKAAEANSINMSRERSFVVHGDRPDCRFNYLGRFPAQFGGGGIELRPSVFNPGPTRSKAALQEYPVNCTARFIGDELIIDLHFQCRKISRAQANRIAAAFVTSLAALLELPLATLPGLPLITGESNLAAVGQPLHYKHAAYDHNTHPDKRSILLTGATGFLGSYLLRELMQHDVIIYCLLRGESQEHCLKRLMEHQQYYFGSESGSGKAEIIPVAGDLLAAQLGIENALYEKIVATTDLIIHAAADINLIKNYAELFDSNITATASIIQLAQTGKPKTLHYVSTLAVSGASSGTLPKHFSEEDLDYGQLFISDYEKTKFEAEKMIRTYLNDGHSGRIYRIGHLAADSVHGKFQRNIGHNRIFQVLKGIMLLRQVPDQYRESIAFSYVDIVAKGIIRSVMEHPDSSMICMHMENPQSLHFSILAEMMRRAGYEVNTVEPDEFRQSVGSFEGEKEEKNVVNLAYSWIQRSIEYPRRVKYVHRHSTDQLAAHGLYFPATTTEWFISMIREGVNAGYFPAPGDPYFSKHPVQKSIILR